MELIYKGAEAELWKTKYQDINCVEKIRTPKKYRINEIDNTIRTARTKLEVLNMIKLNIIINVPRIFDVDLTKKSFVMEFIEGKKIRDIFLDGKNIEHISKKIGESVAKLHAADFVHGDLTTSNMIFNEKQDKVYFVDFGLSQKSQFVEDKAVDLVVFRKMLTSTHYNEYENIWKNFLAAYNSKNKNKETVKKIDEVEKRGRYLKR